MTFDKTFDAIDRKVADFMATNDVDPIDESHLLNIRSWAQSGRRIGSSCVARYSLLEAIEAEYAKLAEVDIESSDSLDIDAELKTLAVTFGMG